MTKTPSEIEGDRMRRAVLMYAESLRLGLNMVDPFPTSSKAVYIPISNNLRAIAGEKHMHIGPDDQCALCLRNFRDSAHEGMAG